MPFKFEYLCYTLVHFVVIFPNFSLFQVEERLLTEFPESLEEFFDQNPEVSEDILFLPLICHAVKVHKASLWGEFKLDLSAHA